MVAPTTKYRSYFGTPSHVEKHWVCLLCQAYVHPGPLGGATANISWSHPEWEDGVILITADTMILEGKLSKQVAFVHSNVTKTKRLLSSVTWHEHLWSMQNRPPKLEGAFGFLLHIVTYSAQDHFQVSIHDPFHMQSELEHYSWVTLWPSHESKFQMWKPMLSNTPVKSKKNVTNRFCTNV